MSSIHHRSANRAIQAWIIELFDFDVDYFRRGVQALNNEVTFLPISCRTGQGLDRWLDWVRDRVRRTAHG